MPSMNFAPFIKMKDVIKKTIDSKSKSVNQTVLIALVTLLITSVIILMLWCNSGSYRPLYGKQEHIDSGQIINVLEDNKIDYKINPDSGQILVNENNIGNTRMLLAAKGVKASLPQGMEALDKLTIGTSQFLEHAKYISGLEGELEKTIMSLDIIDRDRVHLAIPKQTLFVRGNREVPTASVFLQLVPGAKLQPEQITAIANLVAGSITNLSIKNVQIIDQNGNYLTPELSQNSDVSQSKDKQFKYTQEIEDKLIARASNLLESIAGQGNFKVQITPKINFNQVEETLDKLDPESVISSKATQMNKNFEENAKGIPGQLRNLPANKQNGKNNGTMNSQENTQFQIGHSVKHVKHQAMKLEQLSVSVVLNNNVMLNNKNVSKKTGWTKVQLNSIEKSIKDAIGFSGDRGDQFSLETFDFVKPQKIDIPEQPWWQMFFASYAKTLVSGLLGLLLIFFAIIPLIKQLIKTSTDGQQSESKDPENSELKDTKIENKSSIFESDLVPSKNQSFETKKSHLETLAKTDPVKVAEVISEFMK